MSESEGKEQLYECWQRECGADAVAPRDRFGEIPSGVDVLLSHGPALTRDDPAQGVLVNGAWGASQLLYDATDYIRDAIADEPVPGVSGQSKQVPKTGAWVGQLGRLAVAASVAAVVVDVADVIVFVFVVVLEDVVVIVFVVGPMRRRIPLR